jgi:hypothetical protein
MVGSSWQQHRYYETICQGRSMRIKTALRDQKHLCLIVRTWGFIPAPRSILGRKEKGIQTQRKTFLTRNRNFKLMEDIVNYIPLK